MPSSAIAPPASRASRRRPTQARSVVTVHAIFEACIQVLLKDGVQRLTTTRVAERAGVSVGTLYQYYPHKQALLHAVLERHLDGIVVSVGEAAGNAHGQPLACMVDAVVRSFVQAKTQRPDEARALYVVAAELGCADLVRQAAARGGEALAAMLATAADARFNDLPVAAYMFAAAMTGTTKGILEGQAPAGLMPMLHRQLVSLCLGYLEREARAAAVPAPEAG